MAKRVECNGCGGCCDPVVLPYTKDDVARMPPWQLDEAWRLNRAFILAHLTPMPRRQGLERAPHLTQGGNTWALLGGKPVHVVSHFYSCDRYDPEARACTAYDERPPMCRDFPWYGGQPDPSRSLPHACEFHREVGREPVPVEISPRPSA